LPGGSCWKFNGQSLENKFQYFKPDAWEDLAPLEEPDFIKNLAEMLPSIVKRYANDNGRVALSLTGGLDTRIILAYAKPSPGSLPCYTFGGEKGESRDVHLAGIVAKACMQPHTILRIRRDFFEQFQDLAQRTVYMTDGCLDVGGAAELYLNRMARDIAPIRLTGNYGSEVLRLIVAFGYHEPTPGLFHNDLKKIFARSEKNFLEAKKGNLRSFILFKQVPWYHYNRLAIEQSQLMLRSPFLDKNLLQLLYRAPPNTSKDETLSLRLIERGDRNLARIPTDRGAGGHGIHSRIGVLKALEWLLFRAEYLFDYGMPNWLSRVDRFLAPIRLEDLFTGRHRFYNLRSWYRNELAPFVKEILLDPTSLNRPYLERKLVEKMVQEHVNGVGNYSIEINQLITLEYTHRLFVDNR
jgi:asparagine synthase (glutamine-hydrolysing)